MERLYSEKFKRLYLYIIFIIFSVIIVLSKDCLSDDILFFYNRVNQLTICLEDGNFPWFYYKDFNNMGYGNSFFYGDILNYLFIPIVKYADYLTFYLVLRIFILILWFSGSVRLSKVLVDDYYFLSFIFLTCSVITYSLSSCFLVSMLIAQGLSMHFFASTLRFFKGYSSFVSSSLLFWVIINTHNLTATICFIFCCICLIKYFRFEYIKYYIEFCLFTVILCSYYILNFLWHSKSGCLGRISYINNAYVSYTDFPNCFSFFTGNLGQIICNIFRINDRTYGVITLPILILAVYISIKYKKKVLGVCILFLYIICLFWADLFIKDIFQMPIRFYYCIIFYICYEIVINISSNKKYLLYLFGFLEIYLCFMLFSFTINSTNSIVDLDDCVYDDLNSFSGLAVLSGEYLESKFEYNAMRNYIDGVITEESCRLVDSSKNVYVNGDVIDYTEDKEKIIIELDQSGTVQFPKLYYRGYVLKDENGSVYDIWSGYSQFITANLPDEPHTYTLYYSHPVWLKILFLLDLIIVGVCLIYVVFNKKKYFKF